MCPMWLGRIMSRQDSNENDKNAKKRGLFPQYSLEDALEVAAAIKEHNAGKPMGRILLGQALGISPGSSGFRLRITAANQYGLTSGDPYKGDTISLERLGLSIVAPKTDDERSQGLIEAATKPTLFGRFYEDFNNNKVPRPDLAQNKLERDYSVSPKQTERCMDILLKNAKFAGMLQDVQGSQWIVFGASRTRSVAATPAERPPAALAQTPLSPGTLVTPKTATTPQQEPLGVEAVFIAHGKNKKLLGQVKQIVEFGRFRAVVAEEQSSTAIPVPEKVITDMHRCQAGIIIVSADEKVTDETGDEVYRINDNILIEIGAATVLYRQKVILLWDRRI
ncbi:MAG TPA: TIR domain-containing protein, partial [Thermoplasmata archaeon]|nr:TIR domain-containing protein [Thermoplasmata archaeon]